MNTPYFLADTSNTNLSGCTVNGHAASCSQAHAVALAFLIPLFLIIIVLAVYWFKSLFHLIEHRDIPNRALWLILVLFGFGLGAVIYFYAVKRPYDKNKAIAANTPQPQVGAQPYAPVAQSGTMPQGQIISPVPPQTQPPQPPQYPQNNQEPGTQNDTRPF